MCFMNWELDNPLISAQFLYVTRIAKCIKDTYEADAKEVNSLLQLLSIEPAVLPDKVTLSQDSSMILTAINDLNKKITLMMPPIENCTVNDKAVIRLPSGELVHIGDIIYSDDNFATPLGTLEGDNRTHIMIRNDKKELVAIPRKSEKVFRLIMPLAKQSSHNGCCISFACLNSFHLVDWYIFCLSSLLNVLEGCLFGFFRYGI